MGLYTYKMQIYVKSKLKSNYVLPTYLHVLPPTYRYIYSSVFLSIYSYTDHAFLPYSLSTSSNSCLPGSLFLSIIYIYSWNIILKLFYFLLIFSLIIFYIFFLHPLKLTFLARAFYPVHAATL